MTRPLRSNFPRGSYLWSVRNAHWRALGIPEEDCEKPKIAVVNSSSELAACFGHLDQVAVQVGTRSAPPAGFRSRSAPPRRATSSPAPERGAPTCWRRGTVVTNDIEVAVEGAQLDGMVCLTSCDKTVPGQLMAAARLNVPTLLVPCGYQPSGGSSGPPHGHRGGLHRRRCMPSPARCRSAS